MDLIYPAEDYEKMGFWKMMNMYHYLEESTKNFPEKLAVVDKYGSYTYTEILEQVKELAGTLKSLGIQKGDVVSFQLPNWAESVVIHYAIAMIGAICNPIIPIYRSKEVKYILNQS
ncbi:MAG TPA: AMP-binding protein, partial [Chondromyces sp.]|nr:AMP-binding protein [Chondromyces sp.]